MSKGLFITFEGGDGSGKSTQIEKLCEYLKDKGYDVVLSREPGGTAIGEKIRTIILDPENSEMDYMTEAFLYAASRAQHVAQVIKPALDAGKVVICDRFVDSSVAYQGYARGLGDSIMNINEYAIGDCMPDLTILLKLDPKKGKKRISTREEDRIEQEKIEFHQKVFDGYAEIEKNSNGRVVGIDASGGIEEIFNEIVSCLEDKINGI